MTPISLRSARLDAPGPPDASAITAELYAEHAGGQRNLYLRAATDDVFPFLLYTSQDAQVTIGLTDGGHAVVVRDGHLRRIPWPLSIAIPLDSSTAW